MLSQQRSEDLRQMAKVIVDKVPLTFPMADSAILVNATSTDGREHFLFDVNRKGKIKLSKCSYQNRHSIIEILLRLDIDGPPHTNPDGEFMPCPHLHVYREGFDDQWAIALPAAFTDTTDLVQTFREFLKYCNVAPIPELQRSI